MDAMIDIETLDTSPSSVILSIGAVTFDPMGHDLGAEFYQNVKLEGQVFFDRTISIGTLKFWLEQPEMLKATIEECEQGMELDEAIQALGNFLRHHKVECLWAYSPTFDMMILEDACRQMGNHIPWSYRSFRDCRTLMALVPPELRTCRGLHHALEDAKDQAVSTQQAHRYLKGVGYAGV